MEGEALSKSMCGRTYSRNVLIRSVLINGLCTFEDVTITADRELVERSF